MKNKLYSSLFLLLFGLLNSSFYVPDKYNDVYNIFDDKVDQKLKQLSLDEKIGQLFMVPVYSNKDLSHKKNIEELIAKYHIGGIICMKGHPMKQARWIGEFQKQSKIPLLVSMDAEWGLDMRLDSVIQYPKQMTLGAMQNDSLVYEYGREMGRQLKMVGVNVSLSPVADININPKNPVIHMRSFGEDRYLVANKSMAYMKGLQDEGVLAVAKHFPGHGDTEVDSHKDLPIINLSKKRIHYQELHPFKHLFKNGVGGVMTAHVFMPAFEKKEGLPASLSKKIGIKLLRKQLDFKGLTFSDALDMKGVTKYFDKGEIDIMAIMAGNDVLLFPQDIPIAIEAVKKAINDGDLSMDFLDEKVARILKVKEWIAKAKYPKLDDKNIQQLNKKLNTPARASINYKIAQNAITSINTELLLPISPKKHKKILHISTGSNGQIFENTISNYGNVQTIHVSTDEPKTNYDKINLLITQSDTVLISLHSVNPYKIQSKFGLSDHFISFINGVIKNNKHVLLVNFGSPYALELFNKVATLQCYENLTDIQLVAAQIIFGAELANGRLPVSVPNLYDVAYGQNLKKLKVLGFAPPEQVGLNSDALKKIDSIALNAISEKATPGCQILVAKSGKIIYQKSFGTHSYIDSQKVTNTDIYDLASITKITASTLLMMKAYELSLIDLDKTLGDYLGNKVDSLKKDITIREILTHQSGLAAWIPFYRYTLDENGFCDSNYCYMPNSTYSIQVAESLYVNSEIIDTIYNYINRSPLKTKGKYLYSDLGYFYLKKILDSITYNSFYPTLLQSYYNPMGMQTMGFLPLKRFPLNRIIPTEDDTYFRHQLVHGYVHDPGAAMLGGIAGHAGLFSNSLDLAIYMQMLLNGGYYGNTRFLNPKTIELFTSKQYENNRKGLGFDKPEKDYKKPGPTIKDMSADGFGHTGFTGTAVWADPKYDLIYVFLSNRVNPTADNKKLIKMNVRTDIMQVIYDDLLNKNSN